MFDSYPFTDAELSSDRWKKIEIWLALNLPSDVTFSVRKSTSDEAPGVHAFQEYFITFNRSGFDAYEADCGLVLRGPSIILTDLQSHFNFGDPTKPVFFDYVRETPTPKDPPTFTIVQPSNPIGNETAPGSGVFFALPGDLRPNGVIYIAPTGQRYLKIVQLTPFGPRAYYKEVL